MANILRVSYTGFSTELDITIRRYMETKELDSGFMMEEGAEEGERELYFEIQPSFEPWMRGELEDIGQLYNLRTYVQSIETKD